METRMASGLKRWSCPFKDICRTPVLLTPSQARIPRARWSLCSPCETAWDLWIESVADGGFPEGFHTATGMRSIK